jgi:hypothetical protein
LSKPHPYTCENPQNTPVKGPNAACLQVVLKEVASFILYITLSSVQDYRLVFIEGVFAVGGNEGSRSLAALHSIAHIK